MVNVSKMSFPLLCLPILAIFEVLTTMNPFEIINFSISSSRCKKILKLYFRHDCKFEILLHILEKYPTILIKGTGIRWEYKFTSEKKEDNILEYHEEKDEYTETLMKYSPNVVESFFNLFKYIDDLMNFKNLNLLLFEMCHSLLQNDLIIREVKNIRKPINWFLVCSEEDVGNELIDMLNHVKGVETLHLSAPFSKDFEITCPPSLHLLQIPNSKWINLKKLLEFNSPEIIIRDSELTELELGIFIQSWMASESHLNLEKFRVNPVERGTYANISRNLPHEEHDDSVVRKLHIIQTWESLLEKFNIKRNDGTWATIYLTHHNWYPHLLTLEMVVG